MRNRIKTALALAAALAILPAIAHAGAPSVANLDARSRASGNRIDVATAVGERLFTRIWPVQVLQVIANDVDGHVVLGMRLSGVKFHAPTAQSQFEREVVDLVETAFAANPKIEEVDVWVTVPLSVGKGLVVSGDLAAPTTRTVFTVSARRSESASALSARLSAGTNVFLEPEWAATAFTKR